MMLRRCLVAGILCVGLVAPTFATAERVSFNGFDIAGPTPDTPSGETFDPGSLWILRDQRGAATQVRDELVASGLEVVGYVPANAFLVRVVDGAAAGSWVASRGTGLGFKAPLLPPMKVSPELRDGSIASARAGNDVFLVVHMAVDDNRFDDVCAAAGIEITNRMSPRDGASLRELDAFAKKSRYGVRVPAGRLSESVDALAAIPSVFRIEVGSGARLLNDNAAPILQSGSAGGGRPIWGHGLHGEGQVIAVYDTGLNPQSCFFANSSIDLSNPPTVNGTGTGTPDLSRRKVIIYNFEYSGDFGGGAGAFDNQGHGTFVGGNALGSFFTNPLGSSSENGMAPGAKLVVQDGGFIGLDNCSDLAALGCPVIDLTPELDQAVAQGAHIQNNSWGDREDFMPQNTYTGPTADCDDVMWRNPEFLVVCAAGNSGSSNNTVGSPSVNKNGLSVGATGSPSDLFFGSPSPENVTNFSSRGFAQDGRIKPDCTAPGLTVSADAVGACSTDFVGGTSMASPVTAGCAAIVRQYFREGWYPSGTQQSLAGFTPSSALLKATILNGAADMTSVAGFPPSRAEGWGRVHLENSLFFSGDARKLIAVDEPKTFMTSGEPSYDVEFTAGGNSAGGVIRVTLVWTDPPALVGANPTLVNNLDLEVIDGATTYRGNVFNTGTGLSQTGGSADAINNVEMVMLAANSTGTFTARIVPTNIVQPGQTFAFVVGGDVTLTQLNAKVSGWMGYE